MQKYSNLNNKKIQNSHCQNIFSVPAKYAELALECPELTLECAEIYVECVEFAVDCAELTDDCTPAIF